MKKIMLASSFCFLFIACKPNRNNKQTTPDTPKSLTEESSSEISFKSRKGQDLVENLYNELLETDSSLQNFEKSVDNLDEQKRDSLENFQKFDQQNDSYYGAADRHLKAIKDSVLRLKVKIFIDQSLGNYDRKTAQYKSLVAAIDQKDAQLGDMQVVLKLMKTLPMIAKYQAGNMPPSLSLEKLLRNFEKTIQQADSLVWK